MGTAFSQACSATDSAYPLPAASPSRDNPSCKHFQTPQNSMTAFPAATTAITAVFLLKSHCAGARLHSSCSSGSRRSTLNAKASAGPGVGMQTDIEAFKATQTAVTAGTVCGFPTEKYQ